MVLGRKPLQHKTLQRRRPLSADRLFDLNSMPTPL